MTSTLTETIAAYRAGNAAYNALPEEVTEADGDPAIADTYGPSLARLSDWEKPAQSAEEALEALKLLDEEGVSFNSDAGEGMLKAVRGFIEAAVEPPRPATVVKTTLANYCPEIDIAQISIWDALGLVNILAAASTLLNAATRGRPSPAAKYLDNWQALINDATFDIADAVDDMRPDDERERRARNWLLASARLRCADGLVVLSGPGLARAEWDDPFSRDLIAKGEGGGDVA